MPIIPYFNIFLLCWIFLGSLIIDGRVEGRLYHSNSKLVSDGPTTEAPIAAEDLEPRPPLSTIPDAADIISSKDIKRNFISAALGSNMVLQRDQGATLWGYTTPGATVFTSLCDSSHNDDEPTINQKEPRLALTTTAADDDGLWRQKLPPQPASLKATRIRIKSTSGEEETLDNVLFGDVYICGGQSNMAFALPGNTNGKQEAAIGNDYPHIRVFTVGTDTRSSTPMPDLQTVEQKWAVANNESLYFTGTGQSHQFRYFSSVCWFFGQQVADGLNNQVPIGLISNNWGGTAVELWQEGGNLYNAMIHPYIVGPMALTGFTWYQGEANTNNQTTADLYSRHFPSMIQQWRKGFQTPDAYFGFIQLSTWCPTRPRAEPVGVPEMREAQMAALKLPGKIAYATNADHGAGCNIHPPNKKPCGKRLGNSALALQYGQQIQWRSPTYVKATILQTTLASVSEQSPAVVIEFQDVSDKGLYLIPKSFNDIKDLDCSAQSPGTCVWPQVLLNGKGWVNATLSIQEGNKVAMTAEGYTGNIVATSYAWGSIPMMTIYDAGTKLPVLQWHEKI